MSYYLGIDVGSTKIKTVLLKGFSVKIMECFVIDTPRNKKQFLSTMTRLVQFVADKKKLAGIGVGLPGIVDRKRGTLVKAPNLGFLNNWNAKKFLKKFSSRVAIDNDSRCFVRAEAAYGAAKGYQNIIGVTIGTGVGGGIMIGGKMYYGSDNGAGEFGHMVIQVKNSKSKMKSYAWGEAMRQREREKRGNGSEIVGIGVANLVNAFDPDVVVLGGGEVTRGLIKIATIKRVAKKYIMSSLEKNVEIMKGELGYFAQSIGAVECFRRHVE